MNIKPTDISAFTENTVHFLELDYLNEDFQTFVERHLVLLRYAYTVSEGNPNQVIALGDGLVERIYVPFDAEDNQQFFDRVRTSVQNLNLTHVFYHHVIPMIRTTHGIPQALDTMCWYAQTPQDSALGSMDMVDRPGELRTLGPNQPADPETFTGWLVDQLRSFL